MPNCHFYSPLLPRHLLRASYAASVPPHLPTLSPSPEVPACRKKRGKTMGRGERQRTASTPPLVFQPRVIVLALRGLRKIATSRKIIGAPYAAKTAYIPETIMTTIGTWKRRGIRPHKEAEKTISS
ncbi:hypothetical protein AKJ41_03770 [candidate division MSBL1 archaeon SCGC-AAA259O05]|uniref:Uncharacterized protein n=1 Tax=candidate division MSBL1 archaeon SCGC-AAA259O05 TaxID=1698271 RepID=A0A133V2S1_9EURY|nr:hypothetical protein AKJ41_03770 [candidate division MSBL1 archaeon SCGC-AAA259O05]